MSEAVEQAVESADAIGPTKADQRLADAEEKLSRIRREDKGSLIEFKSASTLVSSPSIPLRWTIQGLLAEKSVGVIAGEPKTSKTWALLEMAMAVATGKPAFGKFKTGEAKPVALFLAEDSEQSIRTRLRAMAVGRSTRPEEACARIHLACREHLSLPEQAAQFIAALPAGVGFIGIDPLRDVHSAEENDSGEMAKVMGALRDIRDLTDACVVFTHHTAKQNKDSGDRRSGQRMRGSSAVHGAIDAGFYMELLPENGSNGSRWENKVEVEVKAGRGAGVFTVTLAVEDDDNGEARKAEWAHSKFVSDGSSGGTVESNVGRKKQEPMPAPKMRVDTSALRLGSENE